MQDFINKLEQLDACSEAIRWVETQETIEQAWQNCERGDWLLWLIGKLDIDRKRLVLATCQCARLSLHFIPEDESRPKIAIETAERWTQGEATLSEVKIDAYADVTVAANAYAAVAAVAVAANAYADAAADAAYAYAYAAAVAAVAVAANAADDVAANAADDVANAYAYAAAVAKKEILIKCANIAHKYFTLDEIMEKL